MFLITRRLLFDACLASCASSQDDASNGGRNFVEPWMYEGDPKALTQALESLGYEQKEFFWAKNNGRFEYEFTENDNIIQIRFDGPRPFRRLEEIRLRAGFEAVPVLRNRRRRFGVVQSPFDDFGPSLDDPYLFDEFKDTDPLAPAFRPPGPALPAWIREQR